MAHADKVRLLIVLAGLVCGFGSAALIHPVNAALIHVAPAA